ncbi:MAG TPA: hypothetical protein VM936_17380 [Pyrinomonadaceae bacterium]|jgi:hypothetical protein|nr:hypothetical protein [Pyrinomonadaceae bacterium]
MPSSINYPPDAKGKWSLPVLIALIILAAVSFINFRRLSRDGIVGGILARVRGGQFERLYEEGSDSLHLNVSKEKFVRRMAVAVARMKAIDARLNFQTDESTERILFGVDPDARRIMAIEKLEGDGKSARVLLNWDSEGKFSELTVRPEGDTPLEYAVPGVGAYQYHAADKTLDW